MLCRRAFYRKKDPYPVHYRLFSHRDNRRTLRSPSDHRRAGIGPRRARGHPSDVHHRSGDLAQKPPFHEEGRPHRRRSADDHHHVPRLGCPPAGGISLQHRTVSWNDGLDIFNGHRFEPLPVEGTDGDQTRKDRARDPDFPGSCGRSDDAACPDPCRTCRHRSARKRAELPDRSGDARRHPDRRHLPGPEISAEGRPHPKQRTVHHLDRDHLSWDRLADVLERHIPGARRVPCRRRDLRIGLQP